MRCPKCKLNSFDYNIICPKCKRNLTDIQKELGLLPLAPHDVDFVSLAMNYYLSSEDDDNQDITDGEILDGNNNLITDAEMLGTSDVVTIEPLGENLIAIEPIEAKSAEPLGSSAIIKSQAVIPSATTIITRDDPIELIEAEMVDEPLEAMLTSPPLMTAEMTTSSPTTPPEVADSFNFNELDAPLPQQANLSSVAATPVESNYTTNSPIVEAAVVPKTDGMSFDLNDIPLDFNELDAPLPQQANLSSVAATPAESNYTTNSPIVEAAVVPKTDGMSFDLNDTPLDLNELDAPLRPKEKLLGIDELLKAAKVEPIESSENEETFLINPLDKIPNFPVGAIASSVNVDVDIDSAEKASGNTVPKKASQATLNEEDFLTVELNESDIVFENDALNSDDDLDFNSLDDPEATVPIRQTKATSQVKPAVETFMVDELPLASNIKEESFSATDNFSKQSDDLDVDLDSENLSMPSDFDLGTINDFSDSAYEQIKNIGLAIGKDESGLPLDLKNTIPLNATTSSDDSENVGQVKTLLQEKIEDTSIDFEKKSKFDTFEGISSSQTKLDEKELDELFGSSSKKE